MNAKKICVENQQISDDADKDQKVVINSLDCDSLAKIIMLLPIPERINMEKVCVKWREASQLAWYDIKKYKCESSIGRCYDNRLLTQSYLEKILLKCGNYLKELSLSDVCDSSIMPFIGDHCKNLTTLECKFDIASLIIRDNHFVQAFTQLYKLKCIKIIVEYRRDYYDKTISFFEIIDSLPEEINEIHLLSNRCWYGKRAVLFALRKFNQLQKLTLNGLCLDKIILQEISEKTTLVHLDLQLHDELIEFPLFDKLVNLEYIKIEIESKTTKFVDKELSTKFLNTIFCTCKNLKHLDIPHDYFDVTTIPLKKWKNLQNLEYLCLPCDELSPDLVITIVEYCKKMRYLSLRLGNSRGLLNDNAVTKLTELENLGSLIINSKSFRLSERAIIAISNNCKKLERLELAYCTIVPTGTPYHDVSFVLDELSKLQNLEHLNLHHLYDLEDNTIIAIANNCKNLKSLEIEDCTGLTETALVVALTNLKNLEKLNVSLLYISDSFIIRLRGLKELNCSNCKKLTDTGIIQFIKNNPDLEYLTVRCIKNITTGIVFGASQATKNRTNGIILHIKTSHQSILDYYKSIKSQWLVVEE